MGLIGDLISFILSIIVFILVLMLLWHVVTNGAYYGGMLGSGVNGVIEFVQAFFNTVVG